jgi:transposase
MFILATPISRSSLPTRRQASRRWPRFVSNIRSRLVAMEATGGYEQKALHGLSAKGLPVTVLNPRSVRQFAQSMGRLEKTDSIDAGIIAHYAEVRKSKPVSAAPQAQQQLRAQVTRLRQLTALRTAQRNQARLIDDPLIQNSFVDLFEFIGKQIAVLRCVKFCL